MTLKITWFQPPCRGQGHLPLDQVVQSPVQPGLEHCQGGASTASLGNLCPCLITLTVKNSFLISNLNLPSFSLKPLPLVLSLHALVKIPSPAFLQASPWKPAMTSAWSLFFMFMKIHVLFLVSSDLILQFWISGSFQHPLTRLKTDSTMFKAEDVLAHFLLKM